MSAAGPPKRLAGGEREDLSVRARRLGLSAEERKLFEQARASDPTLRLAHQAGCDFDRIAAVRAGDEELIARVAGRVLGPRGGRRAGSGARRLVWGPAAAVVLASSVAAAWWTGRHPARPTAATSVAPVAAARPPEESSVTAATRAPPVERVEAPSPSIARPARPVTGAAAAARAPGPSAADWFRSASAARRAGAFDEAEARYGELEARFPRSEEAWVARVSLGELLLSTGKAAEAERQFARYLAEGGGELAEEALVGRAQALERLGRRDDALRTWQALVHDHPASVHAGVARQRLRELGVGEP